MMGVYLLAIAIPFVLAMLASVSMILWYRVEQLEEDVALLKGKHGEDHERPTDRSRSSLDRPG